jgi:hypothetical protein
METIKLVTKKIELKYVFIILYFSILLHCIVQ